MIDVMLALKEENANDLVLLENCLIQIELINPMKTHQELSKIKTTLNHNLENDYQINVFRQHLTTIKTDMDIFIKSVNDLGMDEYKKSILLNKEHLKTESQVENSVNDRFESKEIEFKSKILSVIKKVSAVVPTINSSIKPLKDFIDSMLNLQNSDFFMHGVVVIPKDRVEQVITSFFTLKKEYAMKLQKEYSLIEYSIWCLKLYRG